jgi:hypothetical protein
MANEIVDVKAEVTPVDTNEELLKQVDELNSKLADKDDGEWVNVPDYGICWRPNTDSMGKPLGVPAPQTPPPILEGIVQWGKQMDFESLPKNVVIMIKLNADDPMRIRMMQQIIARQVLEPRIEKLKEKHACILFMQPEDDISVMTEEEMNKAGWEKKEKSRIITL